MCNSKQSGRVACSTGNSGMWLRSEGTDWPRVCTTDPRMAENITKTGNGSTLLTLLSHEGLIVGHHRALGTPTPTFLFKGRGMFVHSGKEGTMRTLGPRERPFAAMLMVPRI